MKNSKFFTKVLTGFLAVTMLLSMIPMGLSVAAADADFANAQLSVITEKASTLAPGVTQDAYTVYDKNGDQVKMFVTKADMSTDTVKLFASYRDMDPTNYGMSKLTEQVAAFNEKAAAGDEYYQGTVVAGINASYYNMTTGKPTGTFVMNGIDVTTESEGNSFGYFAVMKDGSVKIGNKNEYSKDKGNIQEAIGIYTMLIVDGEICSGLNTTTKYPRQTIGITADGDVILMTADGNQAPKSIGLTVQEQAQVMLDLGCVWAGHLDGGGSCTYAAKAEGSNEFAIANSPSDGSERSVSNGFIIVSTEAASYEFDKVLFDAESEYVTPGSQINVSVNGVSSTGNAAEIPSELTYEVTNGTYVDGVFTAGSEIGDAVISAVYNGETVSSTTINVVVPQAISFNNTVITVPFGKTVSLDVTATYGLNEVVINENDVKYTLSDSNLGTIDGFLFTAGLEDAGVTSGELSVELVADSSVKATATLTLGKGSEVIQGYEDGILPDSYTIKTGYPQYGPMGGTKDANGNYYYNGQNEIGNLKIVTAENGQVHDGEYALAVECDFSQAYETGYHQLSFTGLNLTVPANAQTIGMWLYLPELEELMTTSMRFVGTRTDTNATVSSPWLWDNCEPYGWENDGWRWVSMDISAYNSEIVFKTIQIYICDRDNADVNFYFKDNASVNGKFTYYMDSITLDYSSAVDDREPPVFTDVRYADTSMSDTVALNGQTVANSSVSFTAFVEEDTTKSNFTGIDASSIKAYVDGVAVDFTYSSGIISIEDKALADGVHTVRFEASDNMGNMSYVERQITVEAGSDIPTISIVPENADADGLLIGSLYWVDLVADSAKDVDTATVTFNLNSMSQWELENMVTTYGFEADYVIDEVSNNATITVTKVGDVADDATVLVKIPVRTWESRLTEYEGYEAQTPAKLWSRKIIWPIDIKLSADYGAVTFTDGTTGSFSMAPVEVITELYGNYDEMNANGDYSNKTSWHIHTANAIDDVAATCTESGYTGRTFCEVCNSVVEWGTTIPATGHTYEVIDGVLMCADDGVLFNGIYTDGKTYVDGVVIADGWTDDFAYYVDGVKLTGLQLIDGYYYDFGNAGVCANKARLDGFYYDEAAGAYMYFVSGIKSTGDIPVYPTVYFFDENGYAISGEVELLGYTCYFDEKGAFVSSSDATVVDAGFSGTNIEYVLLSDGTLKVGGEGVMKDYTANGIYPAWVIKNDTTDITSLEIGNGITKIGKFGFFKNGYLRSVSFEENSSLTTIGWGAFGHCWRLAEVTIPASVETLEEYAFYECGALESFNVEAGSQLTTIKEYAFMSDHAIATVYIPDTVTNIGYGIFAKANADVVMQVVEDSIAHVYALENGINVELRDGVVAPLHSGKVTDTVTWELYPSGTLKISGSGAMANYTAYTEQPWAAYRDDIKKVVIGKDITAVGNYAFAYSQNIEAIEFEEGSKLTSVGVLSFINVPKVTEVTLPDTVTYIGAYAFGDCFALTDLYVPQGTNYIYQSAFNGSAKLVLNVAEGTYAEEFAVANNISYVTRDFIYIPIASGSCGENATWELFENGELRISGSGAMANYTSHTQQPWAAYRDTSIKKVVIGKDITAVGNYAFAYSQLITSVEFEEGSQLTSVGVLSFMNLPKVTSVTLPDTVTYIGAYAFGDCFALTDLYVPQGTNYIYHSAFNGSAKLVLNVAEGTYAEEYAVARNINYVTRDFIYVPIDGGSCGENATWEIYENGELRILGSGAMTNYTSHTQQPWAKYRDTNIKKVVIGKDITAVGNYAFAYSQLITSIEFEEGSQLASVGILSFMNVPKVTSVTLPDTVTYIGAYAFGDCFTLADLYVPQGTNYIYHSAFNGSAKLVLNVAEGTYAEEYAISRNINYVTRDFVYVPIASGSCGDNATWNMYENGELIITGSGAMTNYTAYTQQPWAAYRDSIKKIVIGKDITAVGNYAFAYTQNATAIVFEEGSKLTSVGVLSFMNVPKVTTVTLPETVTYIGAYAFGDCFALTELYIPQGTNYIYHSAFNGSTKLVLNVAEGSYAENFAIERSLSYTTR